MISKIIKGTIIATLATGLFTFQVNTVEATSKVMWGKTELKLGQIGKVTINSRTNLYKLEKDNTLTKIRDLKAGEEFRVYSYKSREGGLYGVGGGNFIYKSPVVKYETPSKLKLALLSGNTPVVKVPNPGKQQTVMASLEEEIKVLNGIDQNGISQKDYYLKVEAFAKKIEDSKSKLSTNEKLIINAKSIGLFAKGSIELTAIVYKYSDGVKVGSTNIQDAHSVNMFDEKIYLNTNRIEQLVSVADGHLEYKGNKLPGGLEDVFYIGAYFNRNTEYFNLDDLLSKQYTTYSITNKNNKTLEYSRKNYPYSLSLTNGSFDKNPYSLEEIKEILDIDFTYDYDAKSGVLTFNMNFESNKK